MVYHGHISLVRNRTRLGPSQRWAKRGFGTAEFAVCLNPCPVNVHCGAAVTRINPHPLSMLWHYCRGEMPNWIAQEGSPVGWCKYSHRGIQRLDNIQFPRKQKRYIFSPKFQIRYDTAFAEVVRRCADPHHDKHTWISPELIEGYCNLHNRGFAHSYEAWQDGQLVGGAFGIHIGGYISVESMFHAVDNASKAAYGQTLLYLKERGFELIDTNYVASHLVNYGEEWVFQWRFEQLLQRLVRQRIDFAPGRRSPELPRALRLALPVWRLLRGVARRLGVRGQTAKPAQSADLNPPRSAPAGHPTPPAGTDASASTVPRPAHAPHRAAGFA